MSTSFDLRKRIYDLYSFDAPYDLEPIGLSQSLPDYAEGPTSLKNLRLEEVEDRDDEFSGLDLTLEEIEPQRGFSFPGLTVAPDKGRKGDRRLSGSTVLGASLTQRKTLLKERIEELIADIHKREKLEGQMLEKAEIESTGLEFLLGQVRTWSLGNYPSVDMRRTNLEREILALKKAGWDEQLRCWRDIVALKKELREVLEEYHLILAAEGL